MSPMTIRDIQEQTIQSLKNQIHLHRDTIKEKEEELEELRSISLLLLHLLGDEVVIDQEEHSSLISEILNGVVGLEIKTEDAGKVITLRRVHIVGE